jgi:hypothetical protein
VWNQQRLSFPWTNGSDGFAAILINILVRKTFAFMALIKKLAAVGVALDILAVSTVPRHMIYSLSVLCNGTWSGRCHYSKLALVTNTEQLWKYCVRVL